MGTKNVHQFDIVMVTETEESYSQVQEETSDTAASKTYMRSGIDRQIEEFSGKIVASQANEIICSFSSALEAIFCGIKLQEKGIAGCSAIHQQREATLAEGISEDTIKVAYALRRLANAGDIIISDRVRKQITDSDLVNTTSLGLFTSGFSHQPMNIYSISCATTGAHDQRGVQDRELPHHNLSLVRHADPSQKIEGIYKDALNESYSTSGELLSDFQKRLSRNRDYAFSAVAKPFSWEAYAAFLKGKFYWETWTCSSVSKAIKSFKKAITISPQYVEAYGWLANCYCFLGITGKEPSWRVFEKAERIIKKAKAIDSSTGEIFVAQGLVDAFLYRDFKKANEAFGQAFANKKCPYFYHLYARYLVAIGKLNIAINYMEKALQMEPDNVLFNAEIAVCYYYNRHYRDALEQFDYTLDLEPSFQSALTGKGWTHILLGEYDEAHENFESYQNLVSHEQRNVPQLVFLSAKLGMRDVAEHFLDVLQLGEDAMTKEVTSIDIALIYYALDKYDETFYHLQRAVDDYIGEALYIKANPLWDNLRNDIRHKKLLRQMNLINTEFFLSETSY